MFLTVREERKKKVQNQIISDRLHKNLLLFSLLYATTGNDSVVIGNVIIPGAPRNSRAAAIDGKDDVLSIGVGEVIDSNVLAAKAVVAGLYACGDMTCSGTTPVFVFRRGRRGDQSPLSFFPNIKIGNEDRGGGESRPGDGTEGERRSSGDDTWGDASATEVGKESCDPLAISLSLSSLPLCCTDTDRQNADLRVDVVASLASSDEGHSSVTAGVGGGDSTTGLRAVWGHKPGGTKRGTLDGDVAGTISAAGRGDRFGLVKFGCVNTPPPPVSAGEANGLERFEFESRRNADLRKDGRAAGALLSLGERGKGERGLGKKERAFSISCCERARGIGEFGTFALKRCFDAISVA
jgi:hypothetical protein